MSKPDLIRDAVETAPNRRSFVKKLGVAGAALGAVAVTRKAEAQSTPAITDFDILNFALNLEYLEAEFYTVATTGMTIDQLGLTVSGTGKAGTTTGGGKIAFAATGVAASYQQIALEIASDERTHVQLLQSSIAAFGGQAIARPTINLNALGFGFGSVGDFLVLARILEDIGVTAYGGAAPLISNSTILGYAARILATEAEHSGNIRLLVALNNLTTTPVDGADIIPPPSGTKYFSVNNNAITEVRTPGQVLYLAYGGAANATSGGFFPNGVNGTLNMSSATPATYDGPTLTANPNPIVLTSGQYGSTTITWNAPGAQEVEIRVDSPTGGFFAEGGPMGSATTGVWVNDGATFYLQDVSNGKALSSANTLATLVVHVTSGGN